MSIKERHLPLGIVLIGRNEGPRLISAMDSVIGADRLVVYVDSGSSDESVNSAIDKGVEVVELDMAFPFTAARARNAGFKRLLELNPKLEYVQFIDGDCCVLDGWLELAAKYLKLNAETAIVCGRRIEQNPESSIYNLMCDMEWNTPIGPAKACGGDFMIRTSVFNKVAGFNESLIAGEEPELCIRVRRLGYIVNRVDADMTLHDASILKFSQWWQRVVRTGYAFAEGAYMYGNSEERHWVREALRPWFWSFLLPVTIILLSLLNTLFTIVILIYPIQLVKMAIQGKDTGINNWKLSFLNLLGKFAEMEGQLKFYRNKMFKKKNKLIEYK